MRNPHGDLTEPGHDTMTMKHNGAIINKEVFALVCYNNEETYPVKP